MLPGSNANSRGIKKWHHEEARVVVATGRYAPRPMVNKRDPFLFRPPVCPPAACFFFLSSLLYPSPGHLKRTSSSFSSHISILSYTKKQYLPPFSLLLCYTAPGRAPPSTNPPNDPVPLFPDNYSSPQSPFVLAEDFTVFRHRPAWLNFLTGAIISVWFSNLDIATAYLQLLIFSPLAPYKLILQGFISCQVYQFLLGIPYIKHQLTPDTVAARYPLETQPTLRPMLQSPSKRIQRHRRLASVSENPILEAKQDTKRQQQPKQRQQPSGSIPYPSPSRGFQHRRQHTVPDALTPSSATAPSPRKSDANAYPARTVNTFGLEGGDNHNQDHRDNSISNFFASRLQRPKTPPSQANLSRSSVEYQSWNITRLPKCTRIQPCNSAESVSLLPTGTA